MNTEQLRDAIKISLDSSRKPKTLNVFYYFHHVFNSQKENAFISTEVLNFRLGVNTKSYKKYFDKWIDSIEDEYVKGEKCRLITKWSDSFIDLMNKTKNINIPQDFFKKIYWNILEIKSNELNILRRVFKDRSVAPVYNNTKTSSFRWYIDLQQLSREEKIERFNGMFDIDIDSCFSSIAYHNLGIKDERLNPAFKDGFRNWVMNDLDVDYKEAKTIICRLFSGKHTKYNKIEWYDSLFCRINKAVKEQIKILKVEYPDIVWSNHQYFTYMEQQIINKVLPHTNLVLRMHDGLITDKEPDMDIINKAAFPHTFTYKCMNK